MNVTLIWFIAGLVLFLLELLTPGFVLACFGVGCLLACIPSFFGGGILLQTLFFAGGSLLSLFLLRPLLNKSKKSKSRPTGIEALTGRMGRVVRAIDGNKKEGRVAVDGDEWLAISSEPDTYIQKGARVEIVGHDSIILIVRPSEQ
ncbi:NfeD family protein [Porphyromonas circumdentaria]|uniref:Membrane protein implicated in regulation of membrane protease activity n=1 Tax=Porphyromonas circumdentaria TaxID=29524 RepID=A0A1T4N0C8_9PORP|nr:NfeD family protein [Porphyromonas circumdentaria]MBB6276006.1 membrane protein implicated in regulation of membrane protease activity [Porphyromonas circumdentaria]MDO4721933.1 NfeD family protein [Porphyromonas circumdentaria]SJZ72733.1 Membrane protein implicated in regulation of membrane protease activity [Porphyromonas circumdentaria]